MYSQLKIFLFLLTRKQPEPPYSVLGLQNQAAASEDHQNLVQLGRRSQGVEVEVRILELQVLLQMPHTLVQGFHKLEAAGSLGAFRYRKETLFDLSFPSWGKHWHRKAMFCFW